MSKLSNKPDEKMRVRNKYVRPKIINHGSANNTKLYFLLKSLDLNVVSTTVNYGRKPTKF